MEAKLETPTLVIMDGVEIKHHHLSSAVTMGRSSSSGVHIKDPSVSRNHCRFFKRKGRWFVTDLESTNNTIVNKNLYVQHAWQLHEGDELLIGETAVHFKTLYIEGENTKSKTSSMEQICLSLDDEELEEKSIKQLDLLLNIGKVWVSLAEKVLAEKKKRTESNHV